jgi:SOUL heme-binding protein
MKYSISLLFALLFIGTECMATKEPSYKVIKTDNDCEIREYVSYCVAETFVDDSDLDEASSQGFRRLFRYISGGNRSKTEIEMTAPVISSKAEKIEMTAPVTSTRTAGGYLTAFVMPEQLSLSTTPVPSDSSIHIREILAHRVAVIKFSGRWTSSTMDEHQQRLMEWISKNGLVPAGQPVIARYDPPFMPWFLRRNEIQIEIKGR